MLAGSGRPADSLPLSECSQKYTLWRAFNIHMHDLCYSINNKEKGRIEKKLTPKKGAPVQRTYENWKIIIIEYGWQALLND